MAAHRAPRWTDGGTFKAARGFIVLLLALSTVLTVGGVATAFFTDTGSGTGSVTTGTLNPPTAVSGVQAAGTGDVTVSWTAPTGTPASGYYVERTTSPSGPTQAACGTSAGSPTASTSCVDTGVAVGTYTYVVVAIHESWTATSAPSAAVTVAQTNQAITFTSSPVAPTFGDTYTVSATGGGSGNPVTFSEGSPGVCTISGATVTFIHAGTCVINADQAGSAYYAAAPQVQQSFEVAKKAQTITFDGSAPVGAVVDGPGYSPSATGGASGNPVTFTIDATATGVCTLSAGVVTYQHVGTCTVNADQAGNADYLAANQVQRSYTVGQGSQAIAFTSTAPADVKVNGSTYTVTATGGASGNAVTFTSATPSVCTVAGSTVSFGGAGTCTINANQAGNADYLAAGQVQQSFAVTKNDQSISFTSTAPAAATFGGSYSATATATSGLPVTFSTDTASVCTVSAGGSVSFVGVGVCHVNADQGGNGAYNAAPQVQQSFNVAKANQTITWGPLAPSSAAAGNTYVATATASPSGLPVTVGVSGACTISGSTVTFGPAAGTCIISASQAGNANYNAATTLTQSVTVNAGDTTNPVITAIEPGNEGPAGWNSIACSVGLPGNQGRICVTATDNVAVTSVTITLTKANGRCWSGLNSTTFEASNCSTPVSLTLSGGVWVSNILVRQTGNGQPNFTNDSYTLAVTVADAAGNTTTATRTFSINGT